jgi:hypothetical protein
MNRYVIFCLFVFFLAVSGNAFAIEGFPGSSWGELRYENSVRGDAETNLILRGWVKQGVGWTHWKDTYLSTYLAVRFEWDTEQFDWNHSIGPAVGIALDSYNIKDLYLTLGAEYIWERFPKTERTEQKAIIYINWYGFWDLKKKP